VRPRQPVGEAMGYHHGRALLRGGLHMELDIPKEYLYVGYKKSIIGIL